MIIHNFNFIRIPRFPSKTQSKLHINANTMLSLTISSQGMQSVPWWNFQIMERYCAINLQQFPTGYPLNIHRKFLWNCAVPYFLCLLITERLDHISIIAMSTNGVKHYYLGFEGLSDNVESNRSCPSGQFARPQPGGAQYIPPLCATSGIVVPGQGGSSRRSCYSIVIWCWGLAPSCVLDWKFYNTI